MVQNENCCVQSLALEVAGCDVYTAVGARAHHFTTGVLAADNSALQVDGVAVRLFAGVSEYRMPFSLCPNVSGIVWYIAE